MTPDDRRLLAAIQALVIDPPGVAFRFVDRLARDNGWSPVHAAAVDAEYRRFLFLAATGDAPATPSDAVDQAWHLHLAYTRSYWDDLCGRVLARPLHHGPTAGGPVEASRYRAQYADTLSRYAAAFGEAPPPAIWPAPDRRFAGRHVRVDRRDVVVLPRRALRRATALPVAAALLLGAAEDGGVERSVDILLLLFAIAFAVVVVQRIRRSRRHSDGSGCGGCGDSADGDGGDGGDSGCGGCGGD